MRTPIKILCILILLSALLGCAAEAPQATATPTEAPAAEPVVEQIEAVTPAPQTPVPTPEPTPVPTPEPTPEPTPTPGPFTIVWMSDTQNLSRHFPDVFNSMRDWILEQREALNIVFVAHTGDVVDGCSQHMWDTAEER